MADISIEGLKEVQEAIAQIKANLDNLEIATKQLAGLMRDYVHVDTGYLQSTIDYLGAVAYADTPYAGAEEERGGSHAYATAAVESFDMESYSNEIVEPF